MDDAAQLDNAENTENVVVPPESAEADESEHAEGSDEFVPKGAMIFALLMITAYIIYYFLIWSEIVVLRGGV